MDEIICISVGDNAFLLTKNKKYFVIEKDTHNYKIRNDAGLLWNYPKRLFFNIREHRELIINEILD